MQSLQVIKKSAVSRFIDDLTDKVTDELYRECLSNDTFFHREDLASGYVEIEMDRNGKTSVVIVHTGNGHVSSNLESAIEDALPSWKELSEEACSEYEYEEAYRRSLLPYLS